MKTFKLLFLFTSVLTVCSCGQIRRYTDLSNIDCTPPIFVSFSQPDTKTAVFSFNESIDKNLSSVNINPESSDYETIYLNDQIVIEFSEDTVPGLEYTFEAEIYDNYSNCLYVLYPFFGYNPGLPIAVINEFTSQGSSSHPDIAEIYVKEGGNTAGMTIFEGTSEQFDSYFVFPDLEVNPGDYMLIHFRPQGIDDEVNETENTDDSGGIDSSDSAWDFWIEGGNGISGNNGVLSLYTSPGGSIIDAVIYSNRTSESDKKYSGFGSAKFKSQAEYLFSHDAWSAEEENIRPEDCINPEDSTSTRSMCRDMMSPDTDSKQDWYITVTGGSSFGYENSTDVYQP